jgi:transcriptional regulator with XRE-family HTH domain
VNTDGMIRQPKTISTEQRFGMALKEQRQKVELSQEELAHRAGYHRTYISLLERGVKSPSLRTVFNLCSVLKIRPSVLIATAEQIKGS